MFNLDQALNKWRRSVESNPSLESSWLDELEDHVRCHIEDLIAEGQSEEQAFESAMQATGSADKINQVYHSQRKNFIQKVCAFEQRSSGLQPGNSKIMISHSIIWAGLIIYAAVVIPKGSAGLFITMLTVAWFVTTFQGSNSVKREIQCFRRSLNKLRRN